LNVYTRRLERRPRRFATPALGRAAEASLGASGHHTSIATRGRRLVLGAAAALVAFWLVAAARVWAGAFFDHPLTLALNRFARRSAIADHGVQAIAAFDLFQGLPVAALVFAAFAAAGTRTRVRLAIGIAAAGCAGILSRLLQAVMDGRSRPLVDPALPFRRPYGGNPELWRDWSSFPSDHATVIWGFAIATYMADRRLGALSMGIATLSSLARLYCGLHYPTDVVAGGLLSTFVIFALLALSASSEDRLIAFSLRRPALLAAVAFLFTAEAATMFAEVRALGRAVARNVDF
jgi:undecaprenyl-diphosphatase